MNWRWLLLLLLSGESLGKSFSFEAMRSLSYDLGLIGVGRFTETYFKRPYGPPYDRFPTDKIDHKVRRFVHGKTIHAPGSQSEYRSDIASDILVGALITFPLLDIGSQEPGSWLLLSRTMAATYLTVNLLKHSVRRPRPKQVFLPQSSPYSSVFTSFPSSHAAHAFAAATIAVLSSRVDSWLMPVGSYLMASSVAFLRMSSDKHFFTDVVGGGLVGSSLAYFNFKLWHVPRPQLSLRIERRSVGLVYRF